jgi:hypothetical protein
VSIRSRRLPAEWVRLLLLAWLALLGGCATPGVQLPQRRPEDVKAELVRRMPAAVSDRKGWADDIYAAFASQKIDASSENLCVVIAVADQESNFAVNPVVPGLAKTAREEIFRRAEAKHIPDFVVNAALLMKSSDGRRYSERLDAVRTERDMSAMFEDFIDIVPLGQRLFGELNPVRTVGSMQVSVAFAEAHAEGYPYPVKESIRHELFTRRGGVYFGVMHLLGYPADYPRPIYRFADFNAGWYASRNAAFQNAVSIASGIPLVRDGDMPADGDAGQTELALRSLGRRIDASDGDVRRALERSRHADFEKTEVYTRVYALADAAERKRVPRALLPEIDLKSPKITRKLTTAWYAERVDERYQRCMRR